MHISWNIHDLWCVTSLLSRTRTAHLGSFTSSVMHLSEAFCPNILDVFMRTRCSCFLMPCSVLGCTSHRDFLCCVLCPDFMVCMLRWRSFICSAGIFQDWLCSKCWKVKSRGPNRPPVVVFDFFSWKSQESRPIYIIIRLFMRSNTHHEGYVWPEQGILLNQLWIHESQGKYLQSAELYLSWFCLKVVQPSVSEVQKGHP